MVQWPRVACSTDNRIRKESTLPRAIAVVVLALAAALAPALPPVAPERGTPARVLEQFDIFKDGDLLLLPVRFKGKQRWFVLDTGTSRTVVDVLLQDELGPPLRITRVGTAGRPIEVPVYAPQEFHLGGLRLHTPHPVAAFDFTEVRRMCGHEVMGIIGMDCLSEHVMQIDWDTGKLAFLTAAPPDCGRPFPLSYGKHGLPFLQHSILGLKRAEKFLIDTALLGASLDVPSEAFSRLVAAGRVSSLRSTEVTTAAGTATCSYGRLDEFTLGAFSHRDVTVGEGRKRKIGLWYLARFVATFDFPRARLYLKKGARYDLPDPQTRCGLTVVRVDGKTLVDDVDKGSAGERHGVIRGDEILAVNGKAAACLRLHQLRQFFCDDGSIQLSIARAGEKKEITIAPRVKRETAASAGN